MKHRNSLIAWTGSLAILIALGGAWQAYVSLSGISPLVLPAPPDVLVAFWKHLRTPTVWTWHIWTTFYETLFGFLLATLIGVPLGILIGKNRTLRRILNPYLVGVQVIPKVALVPLFILWFGFGPTSKVAVSALLAFFPMLANTAFGAQTVEPGMKEMMTTVGASRWQKFRMLEMPHIAAYVFTGAEVAIVLSTIGAIVGEYLAGDRGLGRWVINLQNNLQVTELYGAVLVMAVFGFALYLAVAGARRLIIPWHVTASKEPIP